MSFELPKLNYAYDALDPHIDAQTVEIHYSKHHAAYTNNLNNALAGTEFEGKSVEEVLKNISNMPVAVRNNGGGFFNHNLYWETMSPKGGGEPVGKLKDHILKTFGSLDAFKEQFAKAAMTRFGSGWAWLVQQEDKLVISSTPNQDNPLMDVADVKVLLFWV